MQERNPCVYILASHRNGTLYAGVTSNLSARIWQHRNNVVEGFTQRYCVHDLVWFEMHETMNSAIAREKAIKAWRRAWKIELIENPIRIGETCTCRFAVESINPHSHPSAFGPLDATALDPSVRWDDEVEVRGFYWHASQYSGFSREQTTAALA